jgi:hypothetical protein
MGNNTIDNYEFGELEINDITVSHLHDKNGENWFDDNAGALLLGISASTYRYHLNNIIESSEGFTDTIVKTLKINKTGHPKRFVNFTIINMIAGRSKSEEAMGIVILAGNLLNEKYNQVKGYTEIPEPNHIDVFKWKCEVEDLQGRLKDTSSGISVMSQRARLLEQNGDMEELERTEAVLSDLSNDFNQISLLISNATEAIGCFEKIRELSPKVTNSKYWGQNHLIPFKKS